MNLMLHLGQALLVVCAPARAGGLHQEPSQEDERPDAGDDPGQPTLRDRRLKISLTDIFHHFVRSIHYHNVNMCVF